MLLSSKPKSTGEGSAAKGTHGAKQWWSDESGAWDGGKQAPEIKMRRLHGFTSLFFVFFLCWLTCGIIEQLFLILQISVPLCLLRPASIHPEFQLLTEIRMICEGFWSCARFTPFLEWHGTVACHKHWHLQWETFKASCCSEAEMFN